ncbi:MAG: PaaI family thioesterase [Rhodocyclaceae bacterium]|jgi:hypothetical protein|nr:PaaI family thioesterase [Rhodocyclaceae bacterium]
MQKTPPIPYDPSDLLATSPEVRPALNDHWQVRRELATVLRNLNSALLTSDVPTEQLKSLIATLQAELARIEANGRLFGNKAQAEHFAAQTGYLPFMYHEMSPVMGQSNALAPPLHIWQADGLIHGSVTVGWGYEGPAESVHGGVVALLFDQLLGFGQRISGTAGPTGSLTVRYHHLTPLNKPLRLVARVDRTEGRKKYLVGEIWADELRTASCEGVFIMARNPS